MSQRKINVRKTKKQNQFQLCASSFIHCTGKEIQPLINKQALCNKIPLVHWRTFLLLNFCFCKVQIFSKRLNDYPFLILSESLCLNLPRTACVVARPPHFYPREEVTCVAQWSLSTNIQRWPLSFFLNGRTSADQI